MTIQPVIPLDILGPEPMGSGMPVLSVEEAQKGDFVDLDGPKAEPMPLIPPEIDFSENESARLTLYLDSELGLCDDERFEVMLKLARLERKYRAPFPTEPKDWPIANSSQLTVPVIKSAVNTLTARMLQTVLAADPLVSVRTRDEAWQEAVLQLEEFLDLYGKERLDLEDVIDEWVSEIILLGTGILENARRTDQMVDVSWDPLKATYTRTQVTLFDGPDIRRIPLEDFWIRAAYKDPNKAPWAGKSLNKTWGELKALALSGWCDPEKLDAMWKHPDGDDAIAETTKEAERIEQFEPHTRTPFRIHELLVRWDTDGDGIEEDILVRFHWPSRTILRAMYSPYRRRRPWTVRRFIAIRDRFYGEGLAETLEHLQEEISTTHNQRIDNATIANLRIILVSRLIRGLSPGDRLWTGKIVKVNNVAEDVGSLQLGDIYPSTVQNESIAQQYVREVSGANDAMYGQATPVSRTTATAQMALLEEMNRRFDKVLKGFRSGILQAHKNLVYQFNESGTNGLAEEWLGPVRGAELEGYFANPLPIGQTIRMQILATRSSVNREVEFQTSVAVMNLVNQIGERMLSMTAQLAPQATPLVAHELVKAIRGPWRKIMQYTDPTNVDEALSVLSVLERILPSPEDLGGMGSAQAEESLRGAGRGGAGGGNPGQPGGGNGAPQSIDQSGMEALLRSLAGPQRSGAKVAQRSRNRG